MKKILLLSLGLLFGNLCLMAQHTSPEEVVKESLKAYNARDIDAFMALFDENIEMHNFHDAQVSAQGIEEVRTLYKKFFDASPKLHSKILKRIVIGNKVIDHEYITGGRGRTEAFELVFIYEIKEGKIFRTTAIRQ